VLAPATLAALPSTRAIPDRDVFYVAEPISSICMSPLLIKISKDFATLWTTIDGFRRVIR
jgi:hypothetical protein